MLRGSLQAARLCVSGLPLICEGCGRRSYFYRALSALQMILLIYLFIYLCMYEFQCTIRLSLILVFEVKSNTVREPSLGAGTVVQKPRGQGT